MRGKLLGLAALTCALGGAAFLAPASGESRYPSCDSVHNSRCTEPGAIEYCSGPGGSIYQMTCQGGLWFVSEPGGRNG